MNLRTNFKFLAMLTLGASALVFALATYPANSASNFNITLEFDETGDAIDPCDDDLPACGHDDDLAAIMAEAAARWEDIIEDSHTLHIRYRWVADSLPSADVTMTDANGRPTEAVIRVPANRNYFYDPTPSDDEEFDMRYRLYRTTHPAEKTEAFQGTPLEIFEVGYNGLEIDDDIGADLLTRHAPRDGSQPGPFAGHTHCSPGGRMWRRRHLLRSAGLPYGWCPLRFEGLRI